MKLIEALNVIANAPPDASPFKVGLVTGFTPLHLKTFFQAELQQVYSQRRIEISTGLFGDIMGTLTELNQTPPDAAAIVLEWEDLDSRLGLRQFGGWNSSAFDDILSVSQMRLSQLLSLIRNSQGVYPIALCLPTLPLPPLFTTASWQISNQELTLREQIAAFALSVSQNTNVRIVSMQGLSLVSGETKRLDVKGAWTAGFPYQLSHASALAGSLSRLIKNPVAMKGLVTDLDNTVWSGIVGEIGQAAVSWDLDHHTQAHGLYQQFLSELASEGVLIAAASKNEPAMVAEVFNRDDILLQAEQVFPMAISWGSKARAISYILEQWNIGADSVVFVDDDPLEIAEVQEAHPQVTCLRFFRDDPQATYDLIVKLRDLFGKSYISAEDKLRLESIRANSVFRAELSDTMGFSEALLERAEANVTFTVDKNLGDIRALELINKTNQFNLNGRRLTDAEWNSYLQDPDSFLLTASYNDRFGSLGKIAVVLGRRDSAALHIDTWVMSCRAFARRIEYQTLRFLFTKFGASTMSFAYELTPRNAPFSKLLPDLHAASSSSPVQLTLKRFDEICPRLFHHVLEEKNG